MKYRAPGERGCGSCYTSRVTRLRKEVSGAPEKPHTDRKPAVLRKHFPLKPSPLWRLFCSLRLLCRSVICLPALRCTQCARGVFSSIASTTTFCFFRPKMSGFSITASLQLSVMIFFCVSSPAALEVTHLWPCEWRLSAGPDTFSPPSKAFPARIASRWSLWHDPSLHP